MPEIRRGDLVCTPDGYFGLVLYVGVGVGDGVGADTGPDRRCLVFRGNGLTGTFRAGDLTPQGFKFGTLGTANFSEVLKDPPATGSAVAEARAAALGQPPESD